MNDVLYLIKQVEKQYDDDGFEIEQQATKKEVFCSVQSAKRQEYYTAMRDGVKIALVFTIAYDDYSREKEIEYDGVMYRVERTYLNSEYYIELSCSEVV